MIKVNPHQIPKDNIKVLLSGGVDSVAACHWLKFHYKLDFTVVHFNHEVQVDNHKMCHFVKEFCNDFEIIQETHHRDPIHTNFKDTSENGLRQWRWWVMEGIGGNFISAHHLNDAVENYLSNCFKGNPEHTPIPWQTNTDRGFNIFHPFLRSSKQDLVDYVNENDLAKYVVFDPTNADNSMRRNWIRNKLIPEINTKNLGLDTVVLKKFY